MHLLTKFEDRMGKWLKVMANFLHHDHVTGIKTNAHALDRGIFVRFVKLSRRQTSVCRFRSLVINMVCFHFFSFVLLNNHFPGRDFDDEHSGFILDRKPEIVEICDFKQTAFFGPSFLENYAETSRKILREMLKFRHFQQKFTPKFT